MPTHQLPPYFGMGETPGPECHLAYHSSMMAASWVALAEENVSVLKAVVKHTPAVPAGSSWLTYVRCHDDIGWNVLRPEVEALGDQKHERLLKASHFFAGMTPGSYAQGASFQATDPSKVHGTNGMTAALVGMQSAQTPEQLDLAISRFLLLQSVSFFTGGLPLLYMGDELGQGNMSAEELLRRNGPDGRELHRTLWSATDADMRSQHGTSQQRIFNTLQKFAQIRQQQSGFHGDVAVSLIDSDHSTVLALERGKNLRGFFNFSKQALSLEAFEGSQLALKPFGFAWVHQSAGKTAQTLID